MGISKGGVGTCSGCDREHVRPWGITQCKYLKAAEDKGVTLGVDVSEPTLHIDDDQISQDI